MKKFLVVAVMAMLTFALGCRPGTQVMNLTEVAVSTASQKQAKAEEVRKAILSGCVARGWNAKEVSPGTIEATITVRGKHYVAVQIPYTPSTYSILYKASNNMEYDAAKGTIHPNYNKWVNNLRASIDTQLNLIQL